MQAERTRSGDILSWVTIGDTSRSTARCNLSCATEQLLCSAGDIIVLRVEGEVDLGTLPILRAALDSSFDQHPAHLIIDLAEVSFCSVRGLTLLTQTARIAAEKATGYAVSGVLPRIDRIWILVGEGDLPVRYCSTVAAVTAIRAAGKHHWQRRASRRSPAVPGA